MSLGLSNRMRCVLLLAVLMGLGASGSAMGQLVRPNIPGDAALDGAGWEGRRLVAQMLWVRTHAVLHAGAEERAARPGEETTRAGEFHRHGDSGASEGSGDHAGHDHAEGEPCEHLGDEGGHVLVIPPASEDFRGVLGDLERAVKPYAGADGELYSKDSSQTLPFYRLMTWADPHYIQGYTIGSTFINKVGKETGAALEFLHEGERFNPASFEIQTELGHLYLVYRRDFEAAERHLRRALELLPTRKLTELEEESRTDAYRWLALTYVEWGKPEKAVSVALAGRALIGADPTLDRVLVQRGHPTGAAASGR